MLLYLIKYKCENYIQEIIIPIIFLFNISIYVDSKDLMHTQSSETDVKF